MHLKGYFGKWKDSDLSQEVMGSFPPIKSKIGTVLELFSRLTGWWSGKHYKIKHGYFQITFLSYVTFNNGMRYRNHKDIRRIKYAQLLSRELVTYGSKRIILLTNVLISVPHQQQIKISSTLIGQEHKKKLTQLLYS